MNRRLLLQIATPAAAVGLLLFAACLVAAWNVHRLDANLTTILAENVTSLEASQELEIRVRQLRNHSFIYLVEPTPARLEPIEQDHRRFEAALAAARQSANTPEEETCVRAIEAGYRQYRSELAELRAEVLRTGPRTDFGRLADTHPIRHVTDPCQELFRINKEAMDQTARDSESVTRRAHLLVLLLGLGGPASGLLVGYSVARGLGRSIYRLSVRVQDVAQKLDQNVASMSVAVDGDLDHLDRQVRHVVARVEEVAERLQKQQRDLLRAEQLAAVGQLAASVAHEVRNPVTSIKMLVEAALRPGNALPLTAEDLRVMHAEITRLEQTVQAFLNFGRLPTPERRACDLRDVVRRAVDLVGARARQQGVEIIFPAADGPNLLADHQPLPAWADADQLQTVLVNLFLNALDAVGAGGRIEVAAGAAPGGGWRLTVADTGPGFAPEVADRLFTPFATTKPTGTGLGLSLSRRVLEEHGGTLTAANRPGGGALLTLLLPPGDGPAERRESC